MVRDANTPDILVCTSPREHSAEAEILLNVDQMMQSQQNGILVPGNLFSHAADREHEMVAEFRNV
ncbi:hypothetical protein PABG_05915 [Paracoccidioides brasiliensis Pb03]|uniref:Uncharacterized protein n=2 Tax=Paracoccidioides brasiliensis TaxID=121759 RepID=A0A0A0HRE6_PARBD|nr:uncharacterized protein PADG_12192 [Paracoccidioides brasiliensis Pb18]EEH15828.2 hypothetical protein PABG_05915 [Paracoccidioides brasiliensis Pb03]KGM91734.1 hypothetical protein PADG_12192 [Paracoccidioides brasiliensis Pb18]ODH39358.1 hypothetical protein ACO22_01926 [Paracoccidioides brasiliensis]ODH47636.1 hypothetical protein GX48_06253 [Paracoccidioides brasiliensis]